MNKDYEKAFMKAYHHGDDLLEVARKEVADKTREEVLASISPEWDYYRREGEKMLERTKAIYRKAGATEEEIRTHSFDRVRINPIDKLKLRWFLHRTHRMWRKVMPLQGLAAAVNLRARETSER